MDFFCAKTKLVDIILADYQLLPILNRMGVKFGFGDKTVEDVCSEEGIDVNFFVALINLCYDGKHFSENELLDFPLPYLIDYFRKSHDYYRSFVVSKNHGLLVELIGNDYKNINCIDYIHKVYEDETRSFLEHLDYEENVVFPRLMALSDDFADKEHCDENNLYQEIELFHENHVDKLYDMVTILVKYIKPEKDDNCSNELLFSIFEFIKDLKIHTKIENSVLLKYIKE